MAPQLRVRVKPLVCVVDKEEETAGREADGDFGIFRVPASSNPARSTRVEPSEEMPREIHCQIEVETSTTVLPEYL